MCQLFPPKIAVLIAFCWLSAVNGFAWLMFDPAADDLQVEYSPVIKKPQLALLSSWQPIMYIATAAFATWALTREEGLRTVMRVGALLELAGACLKSFSWLSPHTASGLVLLNVGQVLSGCVAPIAIGTPAHLSAVWFPDHQRTRATGAAVLSNNVGNAVAYLAVPALAGRFGYAAVLVSELLAAAVCVVGAFYFVPLQPKRRHALTESDDKKPKVDVVAEVRELFSVPSMVILCVVYAWSSGGYVAWTSLFDDLLDGRWSDEFIGGLTFGSTATYVVGGALTAALVDSRWHPNMREVLLGSCIGGTVTALLWTLSVPSAFASHGRLVLNWGDEWIFFIGALSGFFNGCAAPVFYELAAELTYPVSEGVSGNVLSLAENVGALALYQLVFNFATPQTMNIAFTAGMVVCVGLLIPVKARYRRSVGHLVDEFGQPDEIATFETESECAADDDLDEAEISLSKPIIATSE